MTPRGHVQLQNVSISYGGREVVHDVSLDIAPGEFVCLLGPSGCGKTTTLRSIAGLAAVASGRIFIDGRQVESLPAHQRGIGMVFQDLALFPHMTVRQNISFGLRLRRTNAGKIDADLADIIRMLHLDGLQDRLPRQLSGGQQQRVAIARSLIVQPSVLLLDEPFAALDRKLREEMRFEIRALQRRLGITVIFVTHDQEEALTMSDRVCVMNHGRLEQVDPPSEIYERPVSRFVMNFVGYANFLRVTDVRQSDAMIQCRLADQVVRLSGRTIAIASIDGQCEIAIRPEHIRIVTGSATATANQVTGVVREVAYEGVSVIYEIALPTDQTIKVREQNIGSTISRRRPAVGDEIVVEWDFADAVLIGGAA